MTDNSVTLKLHYATDPKIDPTRLSAHILDRYDWETGKMLTACGESIGRDKITIPADRVIAQCDSEHISDMSGKFIKCSECWAMVTHRYILPKLQEV